MKKILLISILVCFFSSCSFDKEYKYVEVVSEKGMFGGESLKDDDTEIIKAPSDSVAYIKAFERFCISQKVYKDMQDGGFHPSEEPVSFKLYNDQGIEISNSTLFTTRGEQEKKIRDRYVKMESVMPDLSEYSSDSNNITSAKVDSVKIKELLPFFNKKKDEFDPKGVTWIKPKSAPKYTNRNGIFLYFNSTENKLGPLRLRLQYYADDWLFFNKVQFSVDGKAFEYIPSNTETDHADGMIWEWFDEGIGHTEKDLIEALANAKSAKMKLIGRQYYDIKDISKSQLTDIKRSLDLYRAMGGSF